MSKLKIIIYKIARSKVKKQLTNNLGKVEETKDQLICYVDLKKCENKKYEISIICDGTRKTKEDFINMYKLNKPITYIIEGVDATKKISIYGYNDSNIIIKNSKFNSGLSIHADGTCILENTFIKAYNLLSIGVKNLYINNMNIKNEMSLIGEDLSIMLASDNDININSSNMGKEKQHTSISIIAFHDINISKSTILGDKINMASENIKTDKTSLIRSNNKIHIKADNFKIEKLNTKVLSVNEEKLEIVKGNFKVSNNLNDISKKRNELINILKKIKQQCEQEITEELTTHEKVLCNQSIKEKYKTKSR